MMNNKIFYFDDYVSQIVKQGNNVSGDLFKIDRKPDYTLAILCDGVGSGVKANIAANMCITRIKELAGGGMSLREIFSKISSEFEKTKQSNGFYCAFGAIMFFLDGKAIGAFYDFPTPLILRDGGKWEEIKYKKVESFKEFNFTVNENDAICLMTDGITQAGLGREGFGELGLKGACNLLNTNLYKKTLSDTVQILAVKAKEISGEHDDDTTAVILQARQANILCVLSGPPVSKDKDEAFVKRFLSMPGKKAICGSTTMDIFCKITGKKAEIDPTHYTELIPPEYTIEGIDFASEGAITLNQCFNILNDKEIIEKSSSAPANLARLMVSADIIHFIEGKSVNEGHDEAVFKQMGILPRKEIIDKISKELIKADKMIIKEGF